MSQRTGKVKKNLYGKIIPYVIKNLRTGNKFDNLYFASLSQEFKMATDDAKKIVEREAKWQKRWSDARVFVPKNDGSKPKYYNLIEFPFPSGSGLHVGHMLPYTGMDVMARYKRMRGFDVLFPIGYDSMGISSEKYATKIGKHPRDSVAELIKKFEQDINY